MDGHEHHAGAPDALSELGFALHEIDGAARVPIAAGDGLGLWHQREGAGTLACPVAGPIALGPRDSALHELHDDIVGHTEHGARALGIEFAGRFLADVARIEFGAPAPPALERGARSLDDPALAELAASLARLFGHADRASAVAVARALVTRLLGRHLIGADRRAVDVRLSGVMRHIEDHLDEALRLEALAGVAGLSIYHFSRVFSRHTGETVQAYVRARRVERARALLAGGTMPLAEVAFACGFAHQSHFTATFRTATGETPGAFRTRVQGEGGGALAPPTMNANASSKDRR